MPYWLTQFETDGQAWSAYREEQRPQSLRVMVRRNDLLPGLREAHDRAADAEVLEEEGLDFVQRVSPIAGAARSR